MNAYTILYQSVPDWEHVPVVELQHTGWLPEAPIRAWAQLCRDDQGLWVRMEAEETAIRATLTQPLDEVYTDSCLEFFLAPDPSDNRYLNFEFNPLGNLYLGFGSTRPTRVRQIVGDKELLFHPQPFFFVQKSRYTREPSGRRLLDTRKSSRSMIPVPAPSG